MFVHLIQPTTFSVQRPLEPPIKAIYSKGVSDINGPTGKSEDLV